MNHHLEPVLIADQGWRLAIAPGRSIIGRDSDAAIRLADVTVGRRHAELTRTGSNVEIVDLGSRNGTFVNERMVPGGSRASLCDGDIVRIGSTSLRYAAPAASTSFITRDQYADEIFMADHLTIQQQRESFLREVAASRSRARRLIWIGFVLFIGGFGAYLLMVLQFVAEVNNGMNTRQAFTSGFGAYGLIGFAVALVGLVTMIVGIVRHVVATSRQRHALNNPASLMPSRGR